MHTSEQITRKSASNLALAFILLPEAKRQAMTALYAFCREVDDIADEDSSPVAQRREELNRWREDIQRTCAGGESKFGINRELAPFVAKYRLPFNLFDELIRGVEMDLDQHEYPDYASLETYCYRVASVVGLLSIEIFGFQDARCKDYAIALGQALQHTNILRDIGNDAGRGRIYIPQSELKRHGVTAAEIAARTDSERFQTLCRALADKARGYFRKARERLPDVDRKSMIAAELMGSVYWHLLCELEAEKFPVLQNQPFKLSKGRKVGLVLLAAARVKWGFSVAQYGT